MIGIRGSQNAGMRLYGGAQYHRAMAEYRLVVGNIKCPSVSREEIVNACGVEDIHDGTNYFRYCILFVLTGNPCAKVLPNTSHSEVSRSNIYYQYSPQIHMYTGRGIS